MKRRTTPTLEVEIIGISNSDVSTIDFMFKQDCSESCAIKMKKTYPTNVTYDSTKDVYKIPLDATETCTFRENDFFWLDTRITLTNGKIPETRLVKLKMRRTLFSATDI